MSLYSTLNYTVSDRDLVNVIVSAIEIDFLLLVDWNNE